MADAGVILLWALWRWRVYRWFSSDPNDYSELAMAASRRYLISELRESLGPWSKKERCLPAQSWWLCGLNAHCLLISKLEILPCTASCWPRSLLEHEKLSLHAGEQFRVSKQCSLWIAQLVSYGCWFELWRWRHLQSREVSTYFLASATSDEHYKNVRKKI